MATDILYDKISPTAKLVAYWRSFSNIPFSRDVATLFNCEEVVNSYFKIPGQALDELLVPLVEIRYKCIQKQILKWKIKQVLEFASGISLRGLAMTNDPELIYVESDLAALNEEKIKSVDSIMKKHHIDNRKNLFFHSVNILNMDEIEKALEHFSLKEPLAVIHEGLFQYLNLEEKIQAGINIHKILERFGGMWITPDFETKTDRLKRDIDKEHFQPIMDAITLTTGRDFVENAFENENEIFNFADDLGFSIDKIPQYDDDFELTSCPNSRPNSDILEKLKALRLWILRPKSSRE